LNRDYPVGQYVPEAGKTVYFPYYAIDRTYMSPRREIKRKGWGMSPPEKIYLAIELINRGDIYYANLLLDTPSVGLLDLGDMAKDSAEKWVEAWRTMLTGIDPFKIPVLYEHEKPVSFIPFTKNPAELMFDQSVGRYSGLVAAGYGMTLSDIGFSGRSSGGETLAGTIRNERTSKKTGHGRIKKKVKYWFDRLLPSTLEYKFIDLDDELNVALGRARLATATALQTLIDLGVISPQEGRLQMLADGLLTISIPEKIPPDAERKQAPNNERQGLLGKPIAPSQGGYGEQKSDVQNIFSDIMGNEEEEG
jgi:hypothetical protein